MIATRIGSRREYLYASTTATFDETGDLDYIAIEHALNGQPVKLTQAEQIHAARILHTRGYDLTAIGQHVGVERRTVRTWRENGWKPAEAKPTQPQRELQPCGTRAAYLRHRKNGEDCPTCRAANTADNRRYRRSRSAEETA